MSKVIDFESAKIERGHHKSGPARCMNCKHEWIATSPIGVVDLECPRCSTFQGVFTGVTKSEGAQWQCKCGEWTFFIDDMGPYCAHCLERPSLRWV